MRTEDDYIKDEDEEAAAGWGIVLLVIATGIVGVISLLLKVKP